MFKYQSEFIGVCVSGRHKDDDVSVVYDEFLEPSRSRHEVIGSSRRMMSNQKHLYNISNSRQQLKPGLIITLTIMKLITVTTLKVMIPGIMKVMKTLSQN